MSINKAKGLSCPVLKEISEKNRNLFRLLAELQDALSLGTSKAAIRYSINELYKISEDLFNLEEENMFICNFKKLTKHREDHQCFFEIVSDCMESINHGDYVISPDLIKFMIEWVEIHTSVYDNEFTEYCKNKHK